MTFMTGRLARFAVAAPPFPLHLTDPSRFHAGPREARAGRKQSDGDRADSDRDLSLGKAGQANHDCHHADG